MKLTLIRELHGGFTSWCLLPTILCGTYKHGGDGRPGGWAYLYWLKGRLGLSWKK